MNGTVIVTCARSGSASPSACAERLDRAEDVVPAAGVETGGVVAQLVEDLIHLEGGRQRLDQHGRPHRAAGNAEGILGVGEDVVPEPSFAMALQLGQIEVRARAAVDQLLGVVEKIEPKIEQTAGDRFAVDGHVAFVEMPAAGPDEEGRGFGIQRVLAPVRVLEGDRAAHRVVEVLLAVDDVAPGRRRGVLQIGHEDLGSGVEGVDDHLAIAGAGDLDPAIEEVAGRRGDLPVGVPNGSRLRQEIELGASVDRGLALLAGAQQFLAARVEAAVEGGDEGQRLRAQDRLELRVDRSVDLDPGVHDRLRTVKAISGRCEPGTMTIRGQS